MRFKTVFNIKYFSVIRRPTKEINREKLILTENQTLCTLIKPTNARKNGFFLSKIPPLTSAALN